MAAEVLPHERRRRIVVEHDDVRRGPGLERSDPPAEQPRRDEGVVLKAEPDRDVMAHPRVPRVVPVNEIRRLHLVEHARGESVRPEPDEYPILQHPRHVRPPDRVVHVRLRIVHHDGFCLFENRALALVHVYAVGSDRLGSQDPLVVQPLDDAGSRPAETVLDVGPILRDVNVAPDVERLGHLRRPHKRRILEGEARVESDARPEHPREIAAPLCQPPRKPLVLGQTRVPDISAVAVRDLEANVCPQSHLCQCRRDVRQAL